MARSTTSLFVVPISVARMVSMSLAPTCGFTTSRSLTEMNASPLKILRLIISSSASGATRVAVQLLAAWEQELLFRTSSIAISTPLGGIRCLCKFCICLNFDLCFDGLDRIKTNGGDGYVKNVIFDNFVGLGTAYGCKSTVTKVVRLAHTEWLTVDIDEYWTQATQADGKGVKLSNITFSVSKYIAYPILWSLT